MAMVRISFLGVSVVWLDPCAGFAVTLPIQKNLFPSELCADSTDGHDLLAWMMDTDEDVAVAVAVLSIGPSTISGGGQGLFVTQNVAKGEVLLIIPESNIISVDNAWNDAVWGDAFCYLSDEGGAAGKMASLAGFVAKELLKQRESYWYPYLSMLPQQSSDLDHVLWWSDEDIDTLLYDSNIYPEVSTLREDTDSAMAILWQVLQSEDPLELPSSTSAWDAAVRAAYVAILSRSFEDDSTDSSKLVPILDMTQHAEDANLEHSTNGQTGEIVVKARRDLVAGEELTINYAPDMEPFQFFPIYGFVPSSEGTSCRELLKRKSPLFFPSY
jgi:hypothetical protein